MTMRRKIPLHLCHELSYGLPSLITSLPSRLIRPPVALVHPPLLLIIVLELSHPVINSELAHLQSVHPLRKVVNPWRRGPGTRASIPRIMNLVRGGSLRVRVVTETLGLGTVR